MSDYIYLSEKKGIVMNLSRGFKRLAIVLLIAAVFFMIFVSFSGDKELIHQEVSAILNFFAIPFVCLLFIWLVCCSTCWIYRGFHDISGEQKRSRLAILAFIFGFTCLGLLPGLLWVARDLVWWIVLLAIIVSISTITSTILSIIALIKIKRSNRFLKGWDLAIMGLITSVAAVIFAVIILLFSSP